MTKYYIIRDHWLNNNGEDVWNNRIGITESGHSTERFVFTLPFTGKYGKTEISEEEYKEHRRRNS